jgi:hypothetical protein
MAAILFSLDIKHTTKAITAAVWNTSELLVLKMLEA